MAVADGASASSAQNPAYRPARPPHACDLHAHDTPQPAGGTGESESGPQWRRLGRATADARPKQVSRGLPAGLIVSEPGRYPQDLPLVMLVDALAPCRGREQYTKERL